VPIFACKTELGGTAKPSPGKLFRDAGGTAEFSRDPGLPFGMFGPDGADDVDGLAEWAG
jgi:hypothetical protein